jgi:hypothetical protein
VYDEYYCYAYGFWRVSGDPILHVTDNIVRVGLNYQFH